MVFGVTEKDNNFWKSYNILAVVKNISDSLDDVKQTNLTGMWQKLCTYFVNDCLDFEESVEAVAKKVVDLSKHLDLEMEDEDVTGLLNLHLIDRSYLLRTSFD